MKQQLALSLILSIAGVAAYDSMNVEAFTALNFTQKLDHYNIKDSRTFQQRYWVNDQYFDNKTGPVFLYICGESTCRPPSERGYPFQLC